MRIKLTPAIVAGLLLCTIVIIETPELIKLVDDTSNDFSTVVFVKNAVTVVKVRILGQGRPASEQVQHQQVPSFISAHSLIQTLHASDDVLHMLRVLRT